jgi:hypothetical protein
MTPAPAAPPLRATVAIVVFRTSSRVAQTDYLCGRIDNPYQNGGRCPTFHTKFGAGFGANK